MTSSVWQTSRFSIDLSQPKVMAIVNLTPTPKDNEALGKYSRMAVKLYRAIEILAGVVTPLVKR